MFLFNYRYRLKCILRDRQLMFWTLLFPILLATLFNLALSNITAPRNLLKSRWLSLRMLSWMPARRSPPPWRAPVICL